MRRALKNARIKPHQVDYINAHATGTAVGDAAEALAIRSVMLGEEGHLQESQVNVSGTKGSIGHLLGAAGAIEAVFSILAITENTLPPTLNLHDPNVEPKFNLVPLQAQDKELTSRSRGRLNDLGLTLGTAVKESGLFATQVNDE
ncbi:hypothetical protein O1611_g7491 [Lasiodiplodia mahajangana]|uniref:Uncharacterized protein n=1 Tax=Lasiodiplodia mahajangana TaxID=1108764 RepID=A0ACC2JFF2_9PEZI|nr:hypothetical protein O1611_g7491 [Lasiodiplodia mahajangana]